MKNITRFIIGIWAVLACSVSFGASPRTYLGQSTTDVLVNVPTSIAASTTVTISGKPPWTTIVSPVIQ